MFPKIFNHMLLQDSDLRDVSVTLTSRFRTSIFFIYGAQICVMLKLGHFGKYMANNLRVL